ncbi:peptidoglycan DL-endopeptidase CwlO-like [Ambystoma mexicanum]|uniref:peptidoglycan DL-endopeptidase CwlO-like n=1 Tax=Ambystoma mexicanum TaxID=8296 RepID=UPI0037E8A171
MVVRKKKKSMSSSEVGKFLQKCQKERDEAFRREESSRDKLKRLEAATKTQILELKHRVKETTTENKILHKTIKRLRVELGLEISPRFKGKMTKDIIRELHDKEDQCLRLLEENSHLTFRLKEVVPGLAQVHKLKKDLESQLQASASKTQDLTSENARLSKLLEETEQERDEMARINLELRKSIEETKQFSSKAVQTTTSIPIHFQNTYRSVPRDQRGSQYSQALLEKRKMTPGTRTSTAGSLESERSDNSSQKSSAQLKYATLRS